jgi:multiple antibiotic resistance protein
LLRDVLTSVLTLLVVLNPVIGLAYFSGLTAASSIHQKQMIANRASVVVIVLLLFFAYLGDGILAALGITLHYIMIAGGLFILIFAIKDALGGASIEEHMEESATGARPMSEADAERIAIIPLAVPVLAGPGAMAAVMILNDLQYGFIATGIAVVIDATICWVTMRLSSRILSAVRPSFLTIVGKVMDILVSGVAVAFLIRGITGALGISFS